MLVSIVAIILVSLQICLRLCDIILEDDTKMSQVFIGINIASFSLVILLKLYVFVLGMLTINVLNVKESTCLKVTVTVLLFLSYLSQVRQFFMLTFT